MPCRWLKALGAEIENLSIRHKMNNPPVITISCGVASFFPAKNIQKGLEDIIKDADDALYRAKDGDRNTVYSA